MIKRRAGSALQRVFTRSSASGGESGFTLIELTIVSVILPIVIGAVVVALLAILNDQQSVSTRIDASEAAQLTSALFPRDVESTQYLSFQAEPTSVPASAADWPSTMNNCGFKSAYVPATSLFLVGMEWLPSGATSATVVSYWDVVSSVSGTATYNVVRTACVGTSAPTNVTSTEVVASDVSQSDPPVVTVDCGTGTSCSPSAFQGNWAAASGVSGVSMSVTVADITVSGQHYDLIGYQYNLVGAPRAFSSGSGGVPPPPPFLLTGSLGASAAGVNGCPSTPATMLFCIPPASSPTVSITGGMAFDQGVASEVDLAGSGTLTGTGGVSALNCTTLGTCSSIVTGSGFTDTGNYPPAASMSSPGAQPAAFTIPTAPTTTVTGACDSVAGITTSMTCGPGAYTYGLNINAPNVTVTLTAGNYIFDSSVSEQYSGDAIDFGAGQYTFGGPLVVTGSSDSLISTGSVLFYIPGSQVMITGSGNDISLTPYTTGTDAGVVLYSGWTVSSGITITASTTSVDNLAGLVEDENGGIVLTAASDALDFGSLVAGDLTVAGTGTINVSPSSP